MSSTAAAPASSSATSAKAAAAPARAPIAIHPAAAAATRSAGAARSVGADEAQLPPAGSAPAGAAAVVAAAAAAGAAVAAGAAAAAASDSDATLLSDIDAFIIDSHDPTLAWQDESLVVQLAMLRRGPSPEFNTARALLDKVTRDFMKINPRSKTGRPFIETVADRLPGEADWRMLFKLLDLQPVAPGRGAVTNMRTNLVSAVKAHAKRHPELLDEDMPQVSDDEAEQAGAGAGAAAAAAVPSRSKTVVRAQPSRAAVYQSMARAVPTDDEDSPPPSPAGSPRSEAPASPRSPNRRSKQLPAAARSSAAKALQAFQGLQPLVPGGMVADSRRRDRDRSPRRERSPPRDRSSTSHRSGSKHQGKSARARDARKQEVVPESDSSPSSCSDSDDVSRDSNAGSDSSATSSSGSIASSSDSDSRRRHTKASSRHVRSSGSGHHSSSHRRSKKGRSHEKTFARQYVRNVKKDSGGLSLYRHFKDSVTRDWSKNQEHSKREVLTLAKIIDAALAGDKADLLDVATRRLAAVHWGATSGNWEIGEGLERSNGRNCYVPADVVAGLLKEVSQRESIRKATPREREPYRGGAGANSASSYDAGRDRRGASSTSNKDNRGRRDFKATSGADSSSTSRPGAGSSGSNKK